MYVLTKQEVYIHIPKHNWVHNKDLHVKQMTQGVYMYILRFDKIDIYMKWKHMIIKHVQDGEYKLECMNHQNYAILVHLTSTNEHVSTNI